MENVIKTIPEDRQQNWACRTCVCASDLVCWHTWAFKVLGIDGGVGRLKGTRPEDVVCAESQGVHPVGMTLESTTLNPLWETEHRGQLGLNTCKLGEPSIQQPALLVKAYCY